MKKYLPLTIIFILLIACNEKNEFESKLKIENDSLRNKIKELDTQIQMTDSLKSIYQASEKNLILNRHVKLYMASGELDLRINEYQ